MLLNLVVLRAERPSELVGFYEALGLRFTAEKHGDGPDHYSCVAGATTLEIYPAAGGESSAATRIGFAVDDVRQACAAAARFGSVLSAPGGTR